MNIIRDDKGRFAKGNISGFISVQERFPSKDIARAYANGQSSLTLAKKYNTHFATILNLVRREGVRVRDARESALLGYATGRMSCPSKGKFGEDSSNWKGGKHNQGGYIVVYQPNGLRAGKKRYVFEHILVWEQVHGRPVPQGWVIHHLNGIKSDNRPENLAAFPTQHHVLLIAGFQKRIRELEAKVKILERTLDSQQLLWYTEN